MAKIDVFAAADLAPESAWRIASDLPRFDGWMTLFGGWRTAVPSAVGQGTTVSSLIKVKGFRNVINWRVTRYDEPEKIELVGRGRGGVRITLAVKVSASDRGSALHLTAALEGGLLNGPVGRLVAKVVTSEVRKSLANLVSLAQQDAV